MRMKTLALLSALLFGWMAGCGEDDAPDPTNNLPIAPDFTLQSAEGEAVSLSDYAGHVVFINFWASWCPPCRIEMPHLQELYEAYVDQNFVILAVSLDDPFEPDATDFAAELGLTFPILKGTAEVNQAYGGITAIPTTFVINRQGRIAETLIGEQPYEVFEAALLRHIE